MRFLSLGLLLMILLSLVLSNANDISGFKPLQGLEINTLEEYSPKLSQDYQVFFDQRDILAITLPQDMTVQNFMHLYVKTGRNAVRASMACQLGVPVAQLQDGYMLSQGTVLQIPLTPPAMIPTTCP